MVNGKWFMVNGTGKTHCIKYTYYIILLGRITYSDFPNLAL